MKLYKYIAAIGVLGILGSNSYTKAQDQPSSAIEPSALELFRATSLWFNTANAAGLNTLSQLGYTEVEGGYRYSNGEFRQQQDGKRTDGFVFNAEGATYLNNAYIWGKFSLETENRRGSRFNTSIIDPFRGMPYIKADSIRADWRIQNYNLELKAATPKLFDQLYAGLGIKYNVATGAKQLDPRPANRFYSLQLTPSVVWAANDNNNIGATFYYRNLRETSSLDSKYNEYKEIYWLEGLGAFTSSSVVTGERDYRGNTTGVEVQYMLANDNIDFILSGGYNYGYENVIDGSRALINASKTLTDYYSANAEIIIKGRKNLHKIAGSFLYNDISGIFYDKKKDPDSPSDQIVLDKRERSKFQTLQWQIAYDIFEKKGAGFLWNLGTGIRYSSQEDLYRLPQPGVESSFQNIHRYDFNMHAKYNFDRSIPFEGNLLMGLDVTYSVADDCSLFYGGQDNNHTVVRNLVEKDYAFLSSDYIKFAFNAQYSIPLLVGNKKVSAYGKTSAFYIPKANSTTKNSFYVAVGFML